MSKENPDLIDEFTLTKLQELKMKRNLHLQAIRRYKAELVTIEKQIAELEKEEGR